MSKSIGTPYVFPRSWRLAAISPTEAIWRELPRGDAKWVGFPVLYRRLCDAADRMGEEPVGFRDHLISASLKQIVRITLPSSISNSDISEDTAFPFNAEGNTQSQDCYRL